MGDVVPLPAFGDNKKLVLVPQADIARLLRAYRERIVGKIQVDSAPLLELFERWESAKVV